MSKELVAIFEYLEREKGIKRDIIIGAIEEALRVAARKSIKGLINVSVKIDAKSGKIEVFAQKEVVDEVQIPEEEISLEEARELHPNCDIGDWIDIETTPSDFGRIAAQTAGQIMSQKLRSAERDVIYEEYRDRINELISGTVKRIVKGATLIVDLGKVEALLPDRFYPKTEHYNVGDRVLALLYEVRDTDSGGAEVILSRSHPEFVKQLFDQEVPEIHDNVVVIEKIVRDPGYRTKIAVTSTDPKVEPVGTCIGVRGTRVKNVIRELNNEKIDIVLFSEDKMQFLEDALHPRKIKKINTNKDETEISIVVSDEDYPIVLGKKGTNARLCGQLIGVELEIHRESEYEEKLETLRAQMALLDDASLDIPLKLEGISPFVIEALESAGYDTFRKVLNASSEELTKIPGTAKLIDKILEEIRLKGL